MAELKKGVWTASLTPLDNEFKINVEDYVAHVLYLFDKKTDGVALFGTTGEANSFSIDQKTKALLGVSKAGIDPSALMVGTGCCAIEDTVNFTQACIQMGFSNFLMLPPFYYKGVSEEGIFQAYKVTFEKLPKSDINVIIYDIPQMSGVSISLDLLKRLKAEFPDIVAGVKNSTGDWDAIKKTCETMSDFAVFAGTEQYLLPTVKHGGAGCISATANVTCSKLSEIYARRDQADAERLQTVATKTRLVLQTFPPAPALKYLMSNFSENRNWEVLKPPFVSLSAEQKTQLLANLEANQVVLNEPIAREKMIA